MEDKFIKKLKEISFDALPVKSMVVDFTNSSLVLNMEEFDDIKKEHVPLSLEFLEIHKFISEYPSHKYQYAVTSCAGASFKKIEHELYQAYFIFELEKKNPVYNFIIEFKKAEVHRSLSKEALDYKNSYYLLSGQQGKQA